MRHRDKIHHAVYSFALAVAGAVLFGVAVGAIVALAIGAAKELVWDGFLKRGHADWWDMAANGVGVVAAAVLLGR